MLPKSTLLQSASLGLLLGVMTLVTACGKTDVTLKGQEDALAAKSVTASNHEVVYPDATPSTADGKIVWDKAQCASCHGQGGVGGSAKINLADKGWGRKQKPVEQYEFLYFGKPGFEHPKVADVMTRREAWNLVSTPARLLIRSSLMTKSLRSMPFLAVIVPSVTGKRVMAMVLSPKI